MFSTDKTRHLRFPPTFLSLHRRPAGDEQSVTTTTSAWGSRSGYDFLLHDVEVRTEIVSLGGLTHLRKGGDTPSSFYDCAFTAIVVFEGEP
jgi:hypothetical protein